ncbi:DUF4393 domain-containing protein [Francisellaceae bacterium]|nr:DUF4393 domain-containing protein [Francisellaceae bacterium]
MSYENNKIIDLLTESKKTKANLEKTGEHISNACGRLAELIDIATLPITILNFGIKSATEYFKNNFNADLQRKLINIDSENLQPPSLSISSLSLQGLAIYHTQGEIKNLFLNLLAKSMNSKSTIEIHPAFIDTIKQLSPNEALILNKLSQENLSNWTLSGEEYFDVLIKWDKICEQYIDTDNFTLYLENLFRLQIMTIHDHQEIKHYPAGVDPYSDSDYDAEIKLKSFSDVYITEFGHAFIECCVKENAI